MNCSHGIPYEIIPRHMLVELGNVEICIEHEHRCCDSVYDARGSKDGSRIAIEIASTERFDNTVDLLRFRFEMQFLTQISVDFVSGRSRSYNL